MCSETGAIAYYLVFKLHGVRESFLLANLMMETCQSLSEHESRQPQSSANSLAVSQKIKNARVDNVLLKHKVKQKLYCRAAQIEMWLLSIFYVKEANRYVRNNAIFRSPH